MSYIAALLGASQVLKPRILSRFEIQRNEIIRLVKKTSNLSLLYSDIFSHNFSVKELKVCVKAGVASALYDVSTDWGRNREKYRGRLETELGRLGNNTSVKIALALFDDDVSNNLSDDGLERGVKTLEYICALGGTKLLEGFSDADFKELGLFLQIVDDILDYDEDKELGDHNCFISGDVLYYLDFYRGFLSENSWLCDRPIFGKKLLPRVEKALMQIIK